jgi:hypothetical protein
MWSAASQHEKDDLNIDTGQVFRWGFSSCLLGHQSLEISAAAKGFCSVVVHSYYGSANFPGLLPSESITLNVNKKKTSE